MDPKKYLTLELCAPKVWLSHFSCFPTLEFPYHCKTKSEVIFINYNKNYGFKTKTCIYHEHAAINLPLQLTAT